MVVRGLRGRLHGVEVRTHVSTRTEWVVTKVVENTAKGI